MKNIKFEKYLNKKVHIIVDKTLPEYREPSYENLIYFKGMLTEILKDEIKLNSDCYIKKNIIKDILIQENRKDIIDGKLMSPLGVVKIYVDNKEVDYIIGECEANNCYPDVDAIYYLRVNYNIDGKKHNVYCIIPNLENIKYEYEYTSGEHEHNFNIEYKDLCLTLSCDTEWGVEDEIRENYEDFLSQKNTEKDIKKYFSYTTSSIDGDIIKHGIAYNVLEFSKRNYVVFGISWISNKNEKYGYNERYFQAEFAANIACEKGKI